MLAGLDPAMLIVTAAAGGEADGCLVGFSTQASIHPERLLVCLSEVNRTYRIAARATALGVHVVPRDRLDLARRFGGETGDDVDKLAGVDWRPGPDGAPILAGLSSWLAGRVLERIPLGDHVGFLLEPLEVHGSDGFEPLRQQEAGARIDPGHDA